MPKGIVEDRRAVVEQGGLETDYEYDLLGNLITISQQGLPPETPVVRRFQYDSFSRPTKTCNPETLPAGTTCDLNHWTYTYNYDDNGNLSSRTDARGIMTSYLYDRLDRLRHKDYQAIPGSTLEARRSAMTAPVEYYYDDGVNGAGQLSFMNDASGETYYNYDSLGNIALIRRNTQGEWFGTRHGVDLAGNAILGDDGIVANNGAGRPISQSSVGTPFDIDRRRCRVWQYELRPT